MTCEHGASLVSWSWKTDDGFEASLTWCSCCGAMRPGGVLLGDWRVPLDIRQPPFDASNPADLMRKVDRLVYDLERYCEATRREVDQVLQRLDQVDRRIARMLAPKKPTKKPRRRR